MARRAAITVCVVWGGCLTVHGAYAGSTPTIPVPPDYFGMHLINKANWPTIPVGALGKGTFTNWIYVERARGMYNWSNVDAWVATAERKGVDFYYSFNGIPEWAASDRRTCVASSMPRVRNCPSMPSNIEDFENYVTALVRRYKNRIKYYELWNEPYMESTISIPDMVMLTNRAQAIIRSIDPSAKIISTSLSGSAVNYAERYFAAGGTRDVDIVSLHVYPDPSGPTRDVPEVVTPNGFQLGPLLPVISKYGLQAKPLWDTEGSWGDTAAGAITDPDQQVAFIARSYLLHWSNGLTQFYWYAWDNDTWGQLLGRPAAFAYGEVQKWMTDAVMTVPCAERKENGPIWTCGFSRAGGYTAMAVWTT